MNVPTDTFRRNAAGHSRTTASLPPLASLGRMESDRLTNELFDDRADRPEVLNVWLALRHVFGPADIRLLFETAADGVPEPNRGSPTPQRLRIDAPHGPGGSPSIGPHNSVHFVRTGTALRSLVGFVEARARLRQSHWLVAVLDAESLITEITPTLLKRLQGVDSRLLLIVLEEQEMAETPVAGAIVDDLLFDTARLSIQVDGRHHPTLVDELESLRDREEPAVLRVLCAPTTPPLPARPDLPAAPGDGNESRLVEAIGRVAGENPRVVVVDLAETSADLGSGLGSQFTDRFFEVRGIERNSALVWCAALAQGGCHPLVLVNREFLSRQSSQIAAELCSKRLPATLVVIDRAEGGAEPGDDLSLHQLRLLFQTQMMVPADCSDLNGMLNQCLHMEGPTLLVLPRSPLPETASLEDDDRQPHPRQETAAPAAAAKKWPLFGYSAASLEHERSLVLARSLRPDLQSWICLYEQVGSRNPYLWKWALQGVELTTLPSVAAEWWDHVCDTKVLSIILCVLLDDVADQKGDGALLQSLLQIAETGECRNLDPLSSDDRQYATITRQLFACYAARVRTYPFHEVYQELLTYDAGQYLNTMRYSHLVNHRLDLLNVAEHDLYLPHNMHMMSFATLDLMCSPNFQCQEIGKLREVIWHAQCMGRIANLLSTWQREIGQGDFTAGVFARALLEDDLTIDELSPANRAAIEAAIRDGGHEDYYLRQWHEHRRAFEKVGRRITSMNMESLLANHERFFRMHLGSRGLI